MKKLNITYASNEEFENLRKKYPNALYIESKECRKLKISQKKEIRCYKTS
jgi:ribosomal protein S13